jgi:hypothetical protein
MSGLCQVELGILFRCDTRVARLPLTLKTSSWHWGLKWQQKELRKPPDLYMCRKQGSNLRVLFTTPDIEGVSYAVRNDVMFIEECDWRRCRSLWVGPFRKVYSC